MNRLEKMDDFFAARVDGYDDHMKTNIDGASEFYAYTASLLPKAAGCTVLDLGCGTGLELEEFFAINPGAKVTGIDLSEAMLNALKAKFPDKALTLVCASYFDAPFGENVYDAAVSVESLHHFTAEKKTALYTKLHAALKKDGVFYCATFGEHNFTDELAEWFRLGGEDFSPNHNFTMQNGKEILGGFFENITPVFYEDALHITETEDLVEYLRSLAAFKAAIDLPVQKIRDILNEHTVDGAVDLPKEYGMFICR